MASGSFDTSVKVWNLSTGILKYTFDSTSAGHTNFVGALTFLKSTSLLASGSDDYLVKIWDLSVGRLRYNFNHTYPITALASLYRNLLATASYNMIKIWDISSGNLKYTYDSSNGGHSAGVNTIIPLENNLLASGGYMPDNSVKVWNISAESLKFSFNFTNSGHGDQITCLTQLNTDLLASGSYDGSVKVWNITSGNLKYTLNYKTTGEFLKFSGVKSMAYSKETCLLAAGYAGGEIRVWNVSSVQLKSKLLSHTDIVWRLTFLNRFYLVSGSWDKRIIVWDLVRSSIKHVFSNVNGGHDDRIYELISISDRNNTFASGSADNQVKVWHIIF